MAKHKHIPFVVLGAHDKPNKGMIAHNMKGTNMCSLSIVELANDGKYDYGDTDCDLEDIRGVYQTIIFANVKSVDAMISTLQKIKKLMVKNELPEHDKDAVRDLMAFKKRYTNGESTKG